MPHGGKRDGAGRKKGSPNKASQIRQERVESEGITPLAYMLSVMRDPFADEKRRDEMARAAGPYVHPRLTATEVTGKDGGPMEVDHLPGLSDEDRAKAIATLLGKK